jgi:hypothetical protein
MGSASVTCWCPIIVRRNTRDSLGAIMTLFLVPEDAAAEMLAKLQPIREELNEVGPAPSEPVTELEGAGELTDEYEDIVAKAAELIEDELV